MMSQRFRFSSKIKDYLGVAVAAAPAAIHVSAVAQALLAPGATRPECRRWAGRGRAPARSAASGKALVSASAGSDLERGSSIGRWKGGRLFEAHKGLAITFNETVILTFGRAVEFGD